MKQILDRLVALLIAMSNLTKLSGQKRVNDRRAKNASRNEVQRLPLNPPRKFSEKRRNLFVMVATPGSFRSRPIIAEIAKGNGIALGRTSI
jgi:hypothetical protein